MAEEGRWVTIKGRHVLLDGEGKIADKKLRKQMEADDWEEKDDELLEEGEDQFKDLDKIVKAAAKAAKVGDGRREHQRSNLESQILKVKTRIAELKESKKRFQGDVHAVKTRRDISDEIYSYEKTLADLRQKLEDL